MQKLTPADLDALEAALRAPETMGPGEFLQRIGPFLYHLPALIAAARATVPEPIGEKHRDGKIWQVWDAEDREWIRAYWDFDYNGWVIVGVNYFHGFTPTHALPMPDAPNAQTRYD
jgi:hypothetical protein